MDKGLALGIAATYSSDQCVPMTAVISRHRQASCQSSFDGQMCSGGREGIHRNRRRGSHDQRPDQCLALTYITLGKFRFSRRSQEELPAHHTYHRCRPFHPIHLPTHTDIMFRTAIVRSARLAATQAARPAVRTFAVRSNPFINTSRISTPATTLSAVRCYASSSGLGQEEVTGRILDLLKNFDKVQMDQRRGACEALD